MAIDERNVSAGVVSPVGDDAEAGPDATGENGGLSLDDLRLRLDSPLFARDPGLAAPAQVPRLRELTWEHVTNPTSQHAVITDDTEDPDGPSRLEAVVPPRVRIEDLLSQPVATIETTPPPTADAPTGPPDSSADSTPDSSPDSTPDSMTLGVAPTISEPVPAVRATLPSWGSDRLEEGLVKPIDEPPPLAREADPVVDGLAELIMRTTPSTGLPRVEAVRDSLVRDATGTVPVVAPVPPVVAAVEVLGFDPPAVSGEAPVVPAPPAAPLPTSVQPAMANAGVEAELNRLAFLPDQEDDLGPVEVPSITYAEPAAAVSVATPVLSQNEMYSPRQSAAPASRHAYADLVDNAMPATRRRKRHVARRIVTAVILLAMVAGGLFAVKLYVLDRVEWPKEVAPLVKAVEAERGLAFEHDIPVVTVPVAEYTERIATANGAAGAAGAVSVQSEWRALGLLSGPLDRSAIGQAAMADSPAFYDAESGTVYVVAGVDPELRTFSLHRALTLALLDQHFGWSERIKDESQSVVIGTRAYYDGDAMAVALALLSDDDRELVRGQLFGIYEKFDIQPSPAPYSSDLAGRLGMATWPLFANLTPEQRNANEVEAAFTDGQVLDLRRLSEDVVETTAATSRGMLYWYHVLAGRIDDDLAWNAALGWRADAIDAVPGTLASGAATTCVDAVVSIADASLDTATTAFTEWANSGPPEAGTIVTAIPGSTGVSQLQIHACDPGPAIVTTDGTPRLTFGAAPLRAEQYRLLLRADAPPSAAAAACAVYGNDPVTFPNDERPLVDPVSGWTAPGEHPTPDPVAMNCSSAG